MSKPNSALPGNTPRDSDTYESGFEENSETKEVLPFELPASFPPVVAVDLTPAVIPLPQANPLHSGQLSLIPDILMGWRPKFDTGGPIPLSFDLQQLPPSKNTLRGTDYPCIFNGFRPRDTFVLHKTMRGKSAYPCPFVNSAMQEAMEFISMRDQLSKDQRPFVGMRKNKDATELFFDSTFESGNLDQVFRLSDSEYDLYMRADANTLGHHQWYFFTVTAPPGLIRFNILNFTKRDSLYEQGMLPLVYEEARPALGWHRAGSNVKYAYSKINQWMTARRTYYSLSFEYEFVGLGQVSFAYSMPYTYSRLLEMIEELRDKVVKSSLCKSLSGLDVPLLTITEPCTPHSLHLKEHVIMSARVHPGETHGSFMMEGFLRFITSDCASARSLRRRLEFHIVPMLNPDGVVLGNYRSCLSGSDLNRQFQYPDPKLHPTVSHLKAMIAQIASRQKVLAFIDMHAHSKKKSVFMYGPHYPLHSEKYYTMRVIPKLMSERTEMFRYYSCKFRNDKEKEKAARIVVSKEFGIANSYTLEASFHGFLNSERNTDPFDSGNLMNVGSSLGEVLSEFLALRDEEESQKEARRLDRLRKKYRKKSDGGDADISMAADVVCPKRSMADVIQRIKDDDIPEESDSGGSDSSASEDDLDSEEQRRLNEELLDAYENFSAYFSSKEPRKVQTRKYQRTESPNRPRTASTLAKFFSKARTDVAKRKKPESEAPKSDSKVLRPELLQESPARAKSQNSSANSHSWRPPTKEVRITSHRVSMNISQPPSQRSPHEEPESLCVVNSLRKRGPAERRHSFSFDTSQRRETDPRVRILKERKRDNSVRRAIRHADAQKQWASFLMVQPVHARNRSITLSKKSRSKLYHLEKASARGPLSVSGAEDMLRRYAMLPRTKIK